MRRQWRRKQARARIWAQRSESSWSLGQETRGTPFARDSALWNVPEGRCLPSPPPLNDFPSRAFLSPSPPRGGPRHRYGLVPQCLESTLSPHSSHRSVSRSQTINEKGFPHDIAKKFITNNSTFTPEPSSRRKQLPRPHYSSKKNKITQILKQLIYIYFPIPSILREEVTDHGVKSDLPCGHRN